MRTLEQKISDRVGVTRARLGSTILERFMIARAALVLGAAITLVGCGASPESDPIEEQPLEEVEPTPVAEPEPAPGPESDDGSWATRETTNPLDDTTTVVAILSAAQGVGGFGSDPFSLVARCQSDKTEVYVNWHDYLGDDTNDVYSDRKRVTYRFPPADAVTELWNISTDNNATFVARPILFLRTLAKSDRLVMQTTPYGESPSTAVFELDGAPVAIARIAEGCHWEF